MLNMKVSSSIFICFYVLIYLFLQSTEGLKKGEIEEITDDYFDLKVRKYKLALIMYYAPWCHYCKQLKPHFENAAKILSEEDVPVVFARVDCTDRGKISCARFTVRDFPVLKIFKNGNYYSEYNGPKEEGGIVRTMLALARSSAKKISSLEKLDQFRNYYDSVVVGYFPTKSEMKKLFMNISKEIKNRVRFGIAERPELGHNFDMKEGIIILRPPDRLNEFEPDQVKYNGNPDPEEIKKWISDNLYGLVDVRTRVNMMDFQPPLVVVYCDIDTSKIGEPNIRYWRNRLITTALKFQKDFRIAVSPAENFIDDFQNFGIEYDPTKTETPIVTLKTKNGMKYAMKEEFSPENLDIFITQVINKEIKPYIKSEPLPEDDDHVKVAVGDNFDQVVINNGKDTFIEFYAPWCGHCKQLAPIWKKLAQRMKDEDVVIVKMDGTTNDVFPPYQVDGYPSIYWAGKDTKDKPEKYEGRRSLKAMIEFIAEKSTQELKKYDRKGGKRDIISEKKQKDTISKDEL